MTMAMTEMTGPLAQHPHPAPDRAAPFNALAFLIGVTIYGF